jgi:TolB protein
VDLASGRRRALTQGSAIDTSPSFSPDGAQIVYESDQGGTQQLYVMPGGGGGRAADQLRRGALRDAGLVAKGRPDRLHEDDGGRFHIGTMRPDGSGERLLTASYLDEGPSWSPNGRVLMFYRETPGEAGGPRIYSVDITGRNLRPVQTAGFASSPSWSGLLA